MKSQSSRRKIYVIGNAGGGKTRLSLRLAKIYGLEVTHVDSIQFRANMQMRPLDETRRTLSEVAARDSWLIDGYGPLDQFETRLAQADTVIFIDFPLWRHLWWCAKRQIRALWRPRAELPRGSREATLAHTRTLMKRVLSAHRKMRPEVLKFLLREDLKQKLIWIKTMDEWEKVYENG